MRLRRLVSIVDALFCKLSWPDTRVASALCSRIVFLGPCVRGANQLRVVRRLELPLLRSVGSMCPKLRYRRRKHFHQDRHLRRRCTCVPSRLGTGHRDAANTTKFLRGTGDVALATLRVSLLFQALHVPLASWFLLHVLSKLQLPLLPLIARWSSRLVLTSSTTAHGTM